MGRIIKIKTPNGDVKILGTKLAVRRMVARGDGHIVNIASAGILSKAENGTTTVTPLVTLPT